MPIVFANRNITFLLRHKQELRDSIAKIIADYGLRAGRIDYRFCDKHYIKRINIQFLHHDYYTDIITFGNLEGNVVNADIVIAKDVVQENSERFGTSFPDEMARVIFHGILHLVGLNDKTAEEATAMRSAEEKYLAYFHSLL